MSVAPITIRSDRFGASGCAGRGSPQLDKRQVVGSQRGQRKVANRYLNQLRRTRRGQRVVDHQSYQLDRDAPFPASLIIRETPKSTSTTRATEGRGSASKYSLHRKSLQRSLVEFHSQPGLLWHFQKAVLRFDALFGDEVPAT